MKRASKNAVTVRIGRVTAQALLMLVEEGGEARDVLTALQRGAIAEQLRAKLGSPEATP